MSQEAKSKCDRTWVEGWASRPMLAILAIGAWLGFCVAGVATVLGMVKHPEGASSALDMAEARFYGLGMFAVLGLMWMNGRLARHLLNSIGALEKTVSSLAVR